MLYAFTLVCFGVPFALLLAVIVLVRIDESKVRRAARRFPCTRCGRILGDAAVSSADDLWQRHMRTLHERHPQVKFRIIRTFHAACTECGTRFQFNPDSGTFLEKECVLSFEEDARSSAP